MKTAKRIIILLSFIWLLVFLNWSIAPFIRFTNSLANSVFGIFVSMIPFVVLFYSIFCINKGVYKVLSIIALSLISLVSGIYIFFALIFLPDVNSDKSHEKIHQYNNDIVVYRSDGGATTDFGIDIVKEKKLIPGVVIIKGLYSTYHQYDVRCVFKADSMIVYGAKYNDELARIKIE